MTTSTELLLAGYFLFVLGSILAAGYYLGVRRKAARPAAEPVPEWARDAMKRPTSTKEHLAAALHRIGQAASGKKLSGKTDQKALAAAGYRGPAALYIFNGAKLASATVLAILLLWMGQSVFDNWNAALAGFLIGGVIGHVLPDRVLDAMIRARSSRLRAALPSALDIIALAIEAGQPMDQAIAASSWELRRVHPDISMEFSGIHRELQAGKSRIEALTDILNRNREVELKKVCKLLIDGDRFGTTLAPALRNHARYLRLRSRQKAQEAARKVSVKLVFPVFFLIFPSVILITLGPAVIQISTMLTGLI